jgi:hypothetical protein
MLPVELQSCVLWLHFAAICWCLIALWSDEKPASSISLAVSCSLLPLRFSRSLSTYVMQADILLCVAGCRHFGTALAPCFSRYKTTRHFVSFQFVGQICVRNGVWKCFLPLMVCLSLRLLAFFLLLSRFVSLFILRILSFSLVPSLLFTHSSACQCVLPSYLSVCLSVDPWVKDHTRGHI